MKARLTKYGLCALFVAVMAYFYLLSRDFAGAEAAVVTECRLHEVAPPRNVH